MIRISRGDLLALRGGERWYYALVLDRVRLFGGNRVYAFHRSSAGLLAPEELLNGERKGFHAFVDS